MTPLNSKLLKVPIFPHKPAIPMTTSSRSRESHTYELFLLCRPTSKRSDKSIAYLMGLPHLFTEGQIEPHMEVPAPNSRIAIDFIRPYTFHILRLFEKLDGERLKIEDVKCAYPSQSYRAIRKRMKEIATFERNGSDFNLWKRKPAAQLRNQDEVRATIPPESVCVYESMVAGLRKLLDIE